MSKAHNPKQTLCSKATGFMFLLVIEDLCNRLHHAFTVVPSTVLIDATERHIAKRKTVVAINISVCKQKQVLSFTKSLTIATNFHADHVSNLDVLVSLLFQFTIYTLRL